MFTLPYSFAYENSKTDEEISVIDRGGKVTGGGVKEIEKKNEGWFFYNEKIEAEKKPKPELKPNPKPELKPKPEQKPKPEPKPVVKKGSVQWYRENIQRIRDEAIDDPTPTNVRRYYYAQRIMLDKANKYADTARIVTSTDPIIDENNRRSTSSFAALEQSRVAEEKKTEVLQTIAKKAGIFFFFKGRGCSLCEKQVEVLRAIKTESGISIIPVSIDGSQLKNNIFETSRIDSGQAKKLGITNVPALALAIPPKEIKILSFSAISGSTLRDRIILVAKDAGGITEQEYASTRPFNDNGYIDSRLLEEMPENVLNNPEKFVEYIRKAVEKDNLRTKK